ncbi:MAG: hypothetical protein EA343_14230 [Nodularia sp. (in: Bacteria)]|nr:MAG: hypothetical protein EA343_14230 [Nodularia sp. (in: cyanobacteria)]
MNIPSIYATLKCLEIRLKDIKENTEPKSTQDTKKIDTLINSVTGEIREIEYQALKDKIKLENCHVNVKDFRQCIKEVDYVNNFFKEYIKIRKKFFLVSSSDIIDYIYKLEKRYDIEPEWILPTSTLVILPEESRAISGDDIQTIEDFFQSNTSDHKDDLFINKLMTIDRIHETLERWQKESVSNINIQNRYPILKEALYAHLEGNFFLSVSTLVPQVEGIIRDIIKDHDMNATFRGISDTEIVKAIESLEEIWRRKLNINPPRPTPLKSMLKMLNNLYKDDREISSNDGLDRKGICHGGITNFGTAKNSLKLILILDRIICFYVHK